MYFHIPRTGGDPPALRPVSSVIYAPRMHTQNFMGEGQETYLIS